METPTAVPETRPINLGDTAMWRAIEHAEANPEASIAWARRHTDEWTRRQTANENRDAGWSEAEARKCTEELGRAARIELAAVRALLDGVNPVAVSGLKDALRQCQRALTKTQQGGCTSDEVAQALGYAHTVQTLAALVDPQSASVAGGVS